MPFRKRSNDMENQIQITDKKSIEGKDSVFKIVFNQVLIIYIYF